MHFNKVSTLNLSECRSLEDNVRENAYSQIGGKLYNNLTYLNGLLVFGSDFLTTTPTIVWFTFFTKNSIELK